MLGVKANLAIKMMCDASDSVCGRERQMDRKRVRNAQSVPHKVCWSGWKKVRLKTGSIINGRRRIHCVPQLFWRWTLFSLLFFPFSFLAFSHQLSQYLELKASNILWENFYHKFAQCRLVRSLVHSSAHSSGFICYEVSLKNCTFHSM